MGQNNNKNFQEKKKLDQTMVDDMVTTEWISDIWWNCSKVMKYFEPWWWHVRCVQAIIKSISSTWHAKSNKKKHTNKGRGGNPDAPVQMIDHFANARGKSDPLIYSRILVRVCAHNHYLQNPIGKTPKKHIKKLLVFVAYVCYT